jgi:transcriptional regulator GlxA family with amidase domain
MDEQFLQKVLEQMEKNISEANFGVPELQALMAMSRTQLYRKIKALTDESPGEFMRNYRLKRAAQILSSHGDSVTQIAYAVGFNNLSYFAKCFKELYGVAPSDYAGHRHS